MQQQQKPTKNYSKKEKQRFLSVNILDIIAKQFGVIIIIGPKKAERII